MIDGLKIGDYVTIKHFKLDHYLSADGILSEDAVASNSLSSFEDCLFSVQLQRQYSAAKELDVFMESLNGETDNKLDRNTLKYMHALKVSPSILIYFFSFK